MIALWPRQTTVTMTAPVTPRQYTGPKNANKVGEAGATVNTTTIAAHGLAAEKG